MNGYEWSSLILHITQHPRNTNIKFLYDSSESFVGHGQVLRTSFGGLSYPALILHTGKHRERFNLPEDVTLEECKALVDAILIKHSLGLYQ
jgi:hypothetical protein